MISELITTPCTITRRLQSATRDKYNRRVASSETVTTVCEIQQRRRDEPDDRNEISDTDWVGFFLIDEKIHTGDKVTAHGETYEVVGEPWRATTGDEGLHHVEASLRRTAGAADEVGS